MDTILKVITVSNNYGLCGVSGHFQFNVINTQSHIWTSCGWLLWKDISNAT